MRHLTFDFDFLGSENIIGLINLDLILSPGVDLNFIGRDFCECFAPSPGLKVILGNSLEHSFILFSIDLYIEIRDPLYRNFKYDCLVRVLVMCSDRSGQGNSL